MATSYFSPEAPLSARILSLKSSLAEGNFPETEENRSLRAQWVTGLRDDIDPAIERNRRKWGQRQALAFQFADGLLGSEDDRVFIDHFFNKLGIHIDLDEDETQLLTAQNFSQILGDPRLQSLTIPDGYEVNWGQLQPGALVLKDNDGKNRYLVADTDTNGVRMVFECNGNSGNTSENISIKPMLLIEVADEAFEPIGEEENVDSRLTWNEVHNREPGARAGKDYGQQLMEKNLLTRDDSGFNVAEVAYIWIPVPKKGDEILITVPILKENPVLSTPQEKINAVAEAMRVLDKYMKGDEKNFSPHSRYGYSILRDTLGMSPEEIIYDGEALAELVELLNQAGRTTKGIYGPSDMLPPGDPNDPDLELASQIQNTWEIPFMRGLQTSFMADRVTSERRGRNADMLN